MRPDPLPTDIRMTPLFQQIGDQIERSKAYGFAMCKSSDDGEPSDLSAYLAGLELALGDMHMMLFECSDALAQITAIHYMPHHFHGLGDAIVEKILNRRTREIPDWVKPEHRPDAAKPNPRTPAEMLESPTQFVDRMAGKAKRNHR